MFRFTLKLSLLELIKDIKLNKISIQKNSNIMPSSQMPSSWMPSSLCLVHECLDNIMPRFLNA